MGGGGVYYYDHTGYDPEKDYAIISDGGSSLVNTERYKFAGNENYVDDIEYILDNSTLQSDLKKALGLLHQNIYIDNTVYDAYGNLSSARVRIYSVVGSVGTSNDVIGTYNITSSSGATGKFDYWKQVSI